MSVSEKDAKKHGGRKPLCTQGDWCAVMDAAADRVYYCNKVTKATQWSPPPHWDAAAEDAARQRAAKKASVLTGRPTGFGDAIDDQLSPPSSVSYTAPSPLTPAPASPHPGSAASSASNSPSLRKKSVRFSLTREGDGTATIVDPTDAVFPPIAEHGAPEDDQRRYGSRQSGDSSSVGDWISAVDQQSGREYFYNTVTRKTTWRRPSTTSQPPPADATPAASKRMSLSGLFPSEISTMNGTRGDCGTCLAWLAWNGLGSRG